MIKVLVYTGSRALRCRPVTGRVVIYTPPGLPGAMIKVRL